MNIRIVINNENCFLLVIAWFSFNMFRPEKNSGRN